MIAPLVTFAAGANTLFESYKHISALVCGNAQEQYLKQIAHETGLIRGSVEKLSEHILYLPNRVGVGDSKNRASRQVLDLREVRSSLETIQQEIGTDIISSRMVLTPKKLLKAMQHDPREVLTDIKRIQDMDAEARDCTLIPMMFQDQNASYVGWIKRLFLLNAFDCSYDEEWLPKATHVPVLIDTNQFSKKLPPELQESYSELERLLSNRHWQEADIKTRKIIRVSMGLRFWSTLFDQSPPISKIPPNNLLELDKLWTGYSDSHFGFSRQHQIFKSVNKDCQKLAAKVGWRNNGLITSDKSYNKLTFSLEAEMGHFPAIAWWGTVDGGVVEGYQKRLLKPMMDRMTDCTS